MAWKLAAWTKPSDSTTCPRRVNQVNLRREFFRVTPIEVRDALSRFEGQHLLEFHEEPEALEWRASRRTAADPV